MFHAPDFFKRVASAAICLGVLLAGSAFGADYARNDWCNFKSSSTSLGDTRFVIHKLDINSGRLEVSCMKGKQDLGRFTFTFVPPPLTWSAGEKFDLAVSLCEHSASAGEQSAINPRVELVIRPGDAFLTEGFPVSRHPLEVSLTDLRAAAGKGGNEPLSQKVRAVIRGANEPNLTCGYIITLPVGGEEHRFQFLYEFAHPGPLARWLISHRETQARKAAAEEAAAANNPLAGKPWRQAELQRYFAEYIANANAAIRAKRGLDWSVDAWGRELGPTTRIPVVPQGSWETPSHFLWEQNPRYEFYPVTIRAYLQERAVSNNAPAVRNASPAP